MVYLNYAVRISGYIAQSDRMINNEFERISKEGLI